MGSHISSENKIIRRAYSIASPPHQKKYFELIIRWVRKPLPGRLTTELFNKKENDEVIWLKPVQLVDGSILKRKNSKKRKQKYNLTYLTKFHEC